MTTTAHVLVIDDEPAIVKFVRANLMARGYQVTSAANGLDALEILGREKVDLIILDLMMPQLDGTEVCRSVRSWSQVPILILSARDEEDEKVKALDLGADDYLTKPFGVNELLARVRALLRRQDRGSNSRSQVTVGDLTINMLEHKVQLRGQDVKLTPTEYRLLHELAVNYGKVLTHTVLLKRIWGPDFEAESHYLRVFVGRLRHKIDSPDSAQSYIVTVPGVGYQLCTESTT